MSVGQTNEQYLTNSRNFGVGHCSIGDVEQADKGLIVNLCQHQLDLVAGQSHVAQRPENLGPDSADADYGWSVDDGVICRQITHSDQPHSEHCP